MAIDMTSQKRNLRELNEFKTPVKVVGLTGGIASGKTVATDALRAAGFTVIDADEVSRAVTAKGGECEKALVGLFPAAAKNGAIDRAKLRKLISVDGQAKRALEQYTHPLIINEIRAELAAAKTPVVLSAPLLFETALGGLCDATICITCPTRVRIQRLTARDGVSESDAVDMINAQLPETYRATLADFCVPSDRPADDFTAEIVWLVKRIFDQSNNP